MCSVQLENMVVVCLLLLIPVFSCLADVYLATVTLTVLVRSEAPPAAITFI